MQFSQCDGAEARPLCIFGNALVRAPRAHPPTRSFRQYGNALVLGLQVTIEL
jgi:hypothetical protein